MPTPRFILSLDQGTSSSRAIVFDHAGHPVASAQKEFTQHYPRAGWVEHDPVEIWNTQLEVAQAAIGKANAAPGEIAAAGITNQRETIVVWEKASGNPIHPAIVWQDRRTADFCRKLKDAGHESAIREKTGLFLDPYFSGTKLNWILENVTGARERAAAGELICGTIDCWLIWKLTSGKVHATDTTNASRTLLFNIHKLEWDEELLALLDIPSSMLPEVKSSSETYGTIDSSLIKGEIPIAGVAGDQHAALFGQACFEKGCAKNTYGTGCFLLMNTGETPVVSKNNLLTTVAWKIGEKTEYALEGSVFIGGAVIQWLRDEMKLIQTAQECDEVAATVSDTNGLYLVPAFTGLGAPHWDPYARGIAVGITRGVNRAHFCRAALESIAFQSAELVRAMLEDSELPLKELRVDGGASRSDLLMQFQSDLVQSVVIRPQTLETTALGAAYLAGLAVGFWKSKEEIAKNWRQDRCFEPEQSESAISSQIQAWHQAVDRSKNWIRPN